MLIIFHFFYCFYYISDQINAALLSINPLKLFPTPNIRTVVEIIQKRYIVSENLFLSCSVEPVDARPIPDRGLPTRPGKCEYVIFTHCFV